MMKYLIANGLSCWQRPSSRLKTIHLVTVYIDNLNYRQAPFRLLIVLLMLDQIQLQASLVQNFLG